MTKEKNYSSRVKQSKAIICIVNDDPASLKYWKEELETYCKRHRLKVDLEMFDGFNRVYDRIHELAAQGKKPAMIVSDDYIGDYEGKDIFPQARFGNFGVDKKQLDLTRLPFAVLSGKLGFSDNASLVKNNDITFTGSNCVIHDLNIKDETQVRKIGCRQYFMDMMNRAVQSAYGRTTK